MPKSINFETLDENEFNELFSRVVQAFLTFCKKVGYELTEEQLSKVIEF